MAPTEDSAPSLSKPALPDGEFDWHRLIGLDELPEGRVMTVTVGHESLCVTHTPDGGYGCLGNACPHQGGPLGEGSIEGGWLRCPWHGYDYSPKNGKPPPPFGDAPAAYLTEVRDDGVYAALPVERPRARTVSDVLVETMVAWGVTHVFGMVGHSNLGFADALRAAEARGDLSFVGIRHEGAASFAACAYGKLTGGLAACFAIAGPGSTNLLTGLYDAKMDRAPVLALSGQVPSEGAGPGRLPGHRLVGRVRGCGPLHRHRPGRLQLRGADDLGLQDSGRRARRGPPGAARRGAGVLPAPDGAAGSPGSPLGRTGSRAVEPPAEALAAAVEAVAGAQRPLIIVGHGARSAMADIGALAEQLGAPVATTFKGKGLIGDRHPLASGVLGRSGTPIASWFMNEADLLLTFGVSFANHTGIADYKPIVQIDFDPMALGRFHSVDVPVLAEVGVAARALAQAMPDDRRCQDLRPEVAERWAIWRTEKARRRADDRGEGLNAASVFDALSRLVPADAIMAVDVGNHAYSFGRYFETRGQTVLMSGYLGSIGFSLPAAMGCWAATQQPPRARRPGSGVGVGRRRVRPVRHGAHHRGQARHGHHPRAVEQQRAGQDLQGAAGRGARRVADLAEQPRLRRLRRAVRRPRLPRGRPRSA